MPSNKSHLIASRECICSQSKIDNLLTDSLKSGNGSRGLNEVTSHADVK